MPADLSSAAQLEQTLVIPAHSGAAMDNARHVALILGSQPNFSHEMNNLLRDRLRQASLILFFGYLAFLIKGILLPGRTSAETDALLLWMLAGVTCIMGITAQRLCTQCHYFLGHLRMVELVMFGSSGLLFLVVGYCTLLDTATKGYLVPVAIPWLILMFTYAIYIPNTWQRATLVMAPMAVGPVFTLLLAWQTDPEVAALIENTSDFHHVFLESVMVMSLGYALAVWGVRTMRSLRTAAFEAQQLGQYRLKRLLGRGGMGEVYLAEHVMLKRPCAIKLIRPEMAGDPATLARFEQEVQATARLTHWNTVEIYDYGRTDDGTFYYVMEYLPGMSLDQIVEMHGPMPPGRVIHLISQTCEALAEAHAQDMIHRDIKPANIFAAKRGGTYDVAKLLDFGLVRTLDQQQLDVRLTQAGTVTGSPLYMSPEQAQGDHVDARSDIYALGCVTFYLLTGRPPFEESTPIKLIVAHAREPVSKPTSINPHIPVDLESIVLRCLEKDPADRFSSITAFREALLECQDAGSWTPDAARQWWQSHGCPVKKGLDACISAGLELPPEPTGHPALEPGTLATV